VVLVLVICGAEADDLKLHLVGPPTTPLMSSSASWPRPRSPLIRLKRIYNF
jgi:hypothetical protein